MATTNLGNVSALIKSQTAPAKTYVVWARIIDPQTPDLVELNIYDANEGQWVPLFRSANLQFYYLPPVLSASLNAAPTTGRTVGDRYVVAPSVPGGDAWAGREGTIAEWRGSVEGWQYTNPVNAAIVTVVDEPGVIIQYQGSFPGGNWTVLGTSTNAYDYTGAAMAGQVATPGDIVFLGSSGIARCTGAYTYTGDYLDDFNSGNFEPVLNTAVVGTFVPEGLTPHLQGGQQLIVAGGITFEGNGPILEPGSSIVII